MTVFVVLMTVCGWAQARTDDSVAGLLHREDVQAELKMTPNQIKKWNEIDRLPKVKTGGTFESDPIDIADPYVLDKKNEERELKAWDFLGPSQAVRLMELVIQRAGIRAILRTNVQSALAMSDDQIAEVTQAKSRHHMAVKDLMRKVATTTSEIGRLDPKRVADVQRAIDKTLEEDLDKVITQEQRNALADMGGKKFTFFEPRYGSGS